MAEGGARGIGATLLDEDMRVLRGWWEETSHQLERLQVNPACADEEREAIYDRPGPTYAIPFTPAVRPAARAILQRASRTKPEGGRSSATRARTPTAR